MLAGIVCCGTAVALGAFGAHALTSAIDQWYDTATAVKKLDNWDTGVRYQVWHGIGLVAVGLGSYAGVVRHRLAWLAIAGFLAGVLLFSGGLYLWVLTDTRTFVMIVPLGGVAFLGGWLAFAMSLARGGAGRP